MDQDLRSIQQARDLIGASRAALEAFKHVTQEQVDRICAAMANAGERDATRLAQLAHEETGFGRPESKRLKNLFATRTLLERMEGMKTVGIVNRLADGKIWEVATPMGVVVALVPSTNPTSTAMYKAIIAAKARCGIVMSPHPRAVSCTGEALRVVAEAAYAAGAPEGLFGCMSEVTLQGTNELLEHPDADLILATGGTPMVRAAYSKGKPAYGVGPGNVPVYVDRSANLEKASADILYGASFDWGTLCSTERSVVADLPIRARLVEAFQKRGGVFLDEEQKTRLRQTVLRKGRLNVDIVGQSPQRIAEMAGFTVPEGTLALIAEVTEVGASEPLSMETLSPILSFYTVDGWQEGCDRCIGILQFGGLGHTLAVHAQNEQIIQSFALEKPAMRLVINSVAALGSVGYTNRLFPAMTLGPGTLGGSIVSDNISPLHLLNIKRVAFETQPLHTPDGLPVAEGKGRSAASVSRQNGTRSWMDEIEARMRAGAGNPPVARTASLPATRTDAPDAASPPAAAEGGSLPLPDAQIERLIRQFRRG